MQYLLILFLSEGLDGPADKDWTAIFGNLYDFIVRFVAFVIMVLVVMKFAYKPVRKFLQRRREYVEGYIHNAEKMNEEASKNLEETKANLQGSRKEAVQIIQDAKKEATKQKDAILEEASKELAAKKAKASEDIKQEQEKALKELHDDVVNIALEATRNILDREVSEQDNKKLVDSFVDDLMEK